MRVSIWRGVVAGVVVLALAALASPAAADVPGTATLTGGTLTFVQPASVSFSATLNGTDQNVTASQAIDVKDNTGSGSGWNITLTSTTFTTGSHTLATNSVTDTAASGLADGGVTATLADNSATVYPLQVPAAGTAPAAVKIMAAAANTGMGGQTWTHTMQLAVPSSVYAGTYTSTWTYSIASGP
jgi:hypothetical protein